MCFDIAFEHGCLLLDSNDGLLSSSEQPCSNARPQAAVFEDALAPPLRQRGIEQVTFALPNFTVAEESSEQGSGPQALQPTTQTL